MRQHDPTNFNGVVYDAHVYHSYGDDNKEGRSWSADEDACKTCCRDPVLLAPMVDAKLPVVIGEYSLNTGFPGTSEFFRSYMRDQLSLWVNTPGVLGSFFWNHRILPAPGGWYRELSLLDLLPPKGPLPPQVVHMEISVRCPGRDLGKCPAFQGDTVAWDDRCEWRKEAVMQAKVALQ